MKRSKFFYAIIAVLLVSLICGATGLTVLANDNKNESEPPRVTAQADILPVKPKFSFSFYTDFNLNLYFAKDDAAKISSVKVGDEELTPAASEDYTVYRVIGIPAASAATRQKIDIVINDNGTPVTKTVEYSIIDYANAILKSDFSEEAKEMVCRAVDYVKAVCEYTKVEIPADVTAFVESEGYKAISDSGNVDAIPQSDINSEPIGSFIKSVELKITKAGVYFRFFLEEDIGEGKLRLSSKNFKANCVVENSLIDEKNYFDINLKAYDFYKGTILLSYSGNTGSYDFKTYASSDDVTAGDDEKLLPTMLKIYNYFKETNEYFNTSEENFVSVADVVVKDGKSATVTYTFDDGFKPTATLLKSMLADYENLKLTFALIPGFASSARGLVTLNTALNEETGKYEYVLDENGKYTYTVNEENVEFWRDILSDTNGRIELSNHSLTHGYPGADDEGGEFTYNADGKVRTVTKPVGSVTAEYYAAVQVFKDLFGVDVRTICKPGVSANTEDEEIDGVLCQGYYPAVLEVFERMKNEGLLLGIRGSSYSLKDTQNVADWKRYVDNKAKDGGWALFLIHQVVPDGEPVAAHHIFESQARELFSYTDSDEYWMATLEEATKYYAEWESAEVSAKCNGKSVVVTLTDGEDNTLFNEELTVKVTVPDGWNSCEVNGETLEIKTNENGGKYVYVNIVPDSGDVEIVKK